MSPRIMVIEDDPDILAILGWVLDRAGYDVVLYPTIVEDLAEVAALAPDLIMVDMMFGREPLGAQLLGTLAMDQSTTKIPLIACTGASRAVLMAQDFLQEFEIPLLRKPFKLADLLRTVEHALATAPPPRRAMH